MFSHEFVPQAAAKEQARSRGDMRPSSASAIQMHFSSVPLFEDCSKRELKLIAKTAVVEPRAAGATLVTEGQSGTNAFVILQGKCRVTRNGRRVGEVKAGGIVGELSMLNRAPRNATVIAETPLEVAILARRDFLALLDKSPSIRHKLLTSLAARVQELERAYAGVGPMLRSLVRTASGAAFVAALVAGCSTSAAAAKDVTITACTASPSGGRPTVSGRIVNHSSKASLYTVHVKFADASGNGVGDGLAAVAKVEPGATASWHANGTLNAKGHVTCKLASVTRVLAP